MAFLEPFCIFPTLMIKNSSVIAIFDHMESVKIENELNIF